MNMSPGSVVHHLARRGALSSIGSIQKPAGGLTPAPLPAPLLAASLAPHAIVAS